MPIERLSPGYKVEPARVTLIMTRTEAKALFQLACAGNGRTVLPDERARVAASRVLDTLMLACSEAENDDE